MTPIAPLVLALATDSAAAESSDPRRERVHETALFGGVGGAGGDTAGGVATSFSATHRIHFVELGLELHGAALFSAMGGVAALGGLHIGSDFSLRALAAVGMHGYDGVGNSLLGDDPGVAGSVPFAGGRLVLGYSFGSERRLFLGVGGMLDEDLERKRKSVTYWETDWLFGGEPSQTTSEHTIGQTSWGALALVGVEFDFAQY